MARSRSKPRVFFPWERKRGFLGAIARARLRMIFLVLFVLLSLWLLHRREERASAVRATRIGIANAGRAVASWRADHGGQCPKATAELVTAGYVRDVPMDAWGRPLRLTCPGRRDPL